MNDAARNHVLLSAAARIDAGVVVEQRADHRRRRRRGDLRADHANGRVPDNMRLIRVKQNDVVKLEWRTDKPLTVHLHGYDIEQELQPARSRR